MSHYTAQTFQREVKFEGGSIRTRKDSTGFQVHVMAGDPYLYKIASGEDAILKLALKRAAIELRKVERLPLRERYNETSNNVLNRALAALEVY